LVLPPPLPSKTEILLFLEIFFRSLPCQGSNRPVIAGISRFSGRYAEKYKKTQASIVRLEAVRAHSVKIGPDVHCCRAARPMRDLHSLRFHYHSWVMRTELGGQQYVPSYARKNTETVAVAMVEAVLLASSARTMADPTDRPRSGPQTVDPARW